jgi:tryptophan-rich sensory protein
MGKINILKLITSLLICGMAASIGSFFTAPAVKTWYAYLLKPSFSPPDWVFAPVWTTLFILMGISLYLVREKKWESNVKTDKDEKKAWNSISEKLWRGTWREENAILIFYVQLILNVLWSIIFFGFRAFDIAFIEIIMLWFAILYTIINFYRISKPAGYLLIPYLLWVSLASVLNFYAWWLN